MVDYVALSATAKRLLKANGQNLTFGRTTSTVFDPVLGVDTTTPSSYTGYGAGFSYKKADIDGELVQRGDVSLLLEATTTAPLINDTVTYKSAVYRVMDVEELSPGGTVLTYRLQLRK